MLHWDRDNASLIPKAGGKGLGHRVCTGAGGQMPAGVRLCPSLPEMLIRQTGIVSTSLPRRSLASLSEQIFQKQPQGYLEKHCQCYEMSHAFPAGTGSQEEARGLQPCHQATARCGGVAWPPHSHRFAWRPHPPWLWCCISNK